MKETSFPPWTGPIIGAAAGAVYGVSNSGEGGWGPSIPYLLLWVAAGTTAGVVVGAVDVVQARRKRHPDRPPPRWEPTIASPVLRVGMWFALYGGALIGAFLVYLAVEEFRDTYRKAGWPAAPATVRASAVKSSTVTLLGSTATYHRPGVRYRYVVDGRPYEGTTIGSAGITRSYEDAAKAEAVVARYPAGATPAAYYDPADPARAFLEPDWSWGRAVTLVLAPPAFLTFAGVMGFLLWDGKRRPEPAGPTDGEPGVGR